MNRYQNNKKDDDSFVDISSGSADLSSRYRHKKGKSKKKIILISSVSALVVIALVATGVTLFMNGTFEDKEKEFTFPEQLSVSGISIGDKTVAQAKALLESKENSFVKPFTISIDANDKTTTLSQSDFEYTYDIDEVLKKVESDVKNKDYEDKTYSIESKYTEDSVEKNVKNIEKATNENAKNASVSKFHPYSSTRFEYAEATQGYKLNSEDLTEQIKSSLDANDTDSRIIADVQTVEATIGVDELKKNIINLASYQTVSYNTANGTSNMKTALKACNGSVIEPGATWSFNSCTGDSNLESLGYKSAHVISDGQITDGIGGGICQASSTIYNAAIRANMNVEDRSNHKWASSYVPTGVDATIDYPRLDLKLSNPTDYQMFMECKMDGTTLHVTIWGYRDSFYDKIKVHNEITDKGGSTYTVKAWRVYYNKGKEVNRKSLGSSTYDTENGYYFIDADSDTNDKNYNYVEETTKKSDSSSSSSSSVKPVTPSSSKSSSSQQPATQKPTVAPTTQQPATQQPHTQPATEESSSD